MRQVAFSFAFIALTACSHVDTGQIDYRIADTPTASTTRAMIKEGTDGCTGEIAAPCDPLLPSRVIRRYMPDPKTGWDSIRTGDVYSIEIEQGMVGKNILEGKVLGAQFGNTAEIAVLANVFEFASQSSDAASRRFLEAGEYPGKADDQSDVELKLVYFGDDVRRHQAFNFSNIPLRARSSYAGGSIGIQIVVMEVDAQAGPVASLLTTLARFGQQIVPGPGEAKDILLDLGESLLAGSKDDKLFEYRFVLSAGGADAHAVQATFAPGRYVLRRSQIRDGDMDWANLRLDNNTSRLFQKSAAAKDAGSGRGTGGDGAYKEVRDDLYLVLNVRRYPTGTAPEFYLQKDWADYRGALQMAADAKAAPIDKVTASVGRMLVDSRSKNWGNGLSLSWASAKSRMDVYGLRYRALAADCTDTGLLRDADAAEREAKDAVRDFRREYQQADAAKRKDEAGAVLGLEFQTPDRERLVSVVTGHFMPWTSTSTDKSAFADSAAFQKSFVDDAATGDLAIAGLRAAARKADPKTTCGLPT